MKVIRPDFKIINTDKISGIDLLKTIEIAGRTCYKSENKITDDSYIRFIKNLINRNHGAMLEFADIFVVITCDRGVSHELVRHRLASYAQESTRYCNYTNDKFGNELTFILPTKFFNDTSKDNVSYNTWYNEMKDAEINYQKMIASGCTPQEARSILPNSLKTEISMKTNIREWRHFFKLRTAKDAHPDMRNIAIEMLYGFNEYVPIVFEDIIKNLEEN